MKKTCYSIHPQLEQELSKAAELCGIAKGKLLKRVLMKYISSMYKSEFNHGTTIKYNARLNVKHIIKTLRLDDEEYSILLQCRFYMRLSVSLIIADAIRYRLSRIVRASLKLKNKLKRPIIGFFEKPLRVSKNFQIFWPFIKTKLVPFLVQRWDSCLL